MSLTIDKKSGIMDNVVFCYTKMRDPVFKYQSKTEKEFTVDCVVDKATAKEWKKVFKKNPVKEIDNDDFEEIFKIEPPFEDQDEQFVIKLKAPAQDKKGNLKPAKFLPKVLVPNEDENSDADYVDVTDSVLVANGSAGKVAFNVLSNDFGTFPQLNAILVEELIEYEEGGSNPFGGKVSGERSELDEDDYEDSDEEDVEEGSEDVAEAPEEEEEKPAKSSRRKAKKSSTKTEQEPEEFDEDIPF